MTHDKMLQSSLKSKGTISVLTTASLVILLNVHTALVESSSTANSHIRFYGAQSYISGALPQGGQPMTEDDLGSFLAHQMGVSPAHDVGVNFVNHTPPFSRPKSIILFAHNGDVSSSAGVPSNEDGAYGFSTTCSCMNCLADQLTRRSRMVLAETSVSLNGDQQFAYVTSEEVQLQHTRIHEIFNRSYMPILTSLGLHEITYRSVMAGEEPEKRTETPSKGEHKIAFTVPDVLNELVAVDASSSSSHVVMRLQTAVQGVPTEVKFERNDPCTTALFEELHLTAIDLEECLKAENSSIAPLLCLVSPQTTIQCLKNKYGVDAVSPQSHIASYLLRRVASILAMDTTSHRNAIAIELAAGQLKVCSEEYSTTRGAVDIRTRLAGFTPDVQGNVVSSRRALAEEQPEEAPPAPSLKDLTEEERTRDQVATHKQITIWVTVVLAIIIAYSIYLMMAMTNERDPLLYTKVAATS